MVVIRIFFRKMYCSYLVQLLIRSEFLTEQPQAHCQSYGSVRGQDTMGAESLCKSEIPQLDICRRPIAVMQVLCCTKALADTCFWSNVRSCEGKSRLSDYIFIFFLILAYCFSVTRISHLDLWKLEPQVMGRLVFVNQNTGCSQL